MAIKQLVEDIKNHVKKLTLNADFIELYDVDNNTVTFYVADQNSIAEGVEATPDGEFLFSDGTKIVIENGKVTSIETSKEEKVEETIETEEVKDEEKIEEEIEKKEEITEEPKEDKDAKIAELEAEIEKLKAELAAEKAAVTEKEEEIKEIEDDLKEI